MKQSDKSWTGKKTTTNPLSSISVSVITNKCIGDGACVAFAPGTFKLDDENKAIVHNQEGSSDQEKLLAAQICPVKAIIAKDVKTGKQLWPLPLKKPVD